MLGFRFYARRWMKEQLAKLESGDLSMEYSQAAGDTALVAAFKKMIWNFKSLLRIVDRASRLLHMRMEEMNIKSSRLAEQVDGVTDTVRGIADGMRTSSKQALWMADGIAQINETLQRTAANNEMIIGAAQQLSNTAAAGQAEAAEAAIVVQRLTDRAASRQDRIDQLQISLDEIAKLASRIGQIADQTARAAHHPVMEKGSGAGSDVAEEVAKLSAQAKEAALQIGERVRILSGNTDELKAEATRMNEAACAGARAMNASLGHYAAIERFVGTIPESMASADNQIAIFVDGSASIAAAINESSVFMQETASGCEEMIAAAELQQQTIRLMKEDIHETTRGSMALRSIVSQFILPARSELTPLQKSLERWMECALGIRSIMMSLIDSRDIERIRYWNREKEVMEAKLDRCFQDLEEIASQAKHKRRLIGLKEAWQRFHEAKNQNAKWMLGFEFEKARHGLTNRGRIRFKHAMDLAAEWLEMK